MSKTRVLFLCTANSARSQMAEAFLRRHAGGSFEAFSAGLEPGEINPLTRQVMAEVGYDLDGHHSKALSQFLGRVHFGYLITVCDRAEERCPAVFPGLGQRFHWSIPDPAAVQGSEEEKLAGFRAARDEIEERIIAWLREL